MVHAGATAMEECGRQRPEWSQRRPPGSRGLHSGSLLATLASIYFLSFPTEVDVSTIYELFYCWRRLLSRVYGCWGLFRACRQRASSRLTVEIAHR